MPALKSEELPVIDREEALERLGGDTAFLDELLTLYKKEYRARSAAMKKALAGRKFKEFAEAAHSLKGSSANLSLPALRAAALAAEEAGKAKDAGKAAAAFGALEKEFKRLVDGPIRP
jgi:HPt (histidine-containing phosphotransfer) domain-containing protein